MVYTDQAESTTPGRPMTGSKWNNNNKINCFTLFVHSVSKYIYALKPPYQAELCNTFTYFAVVKNTGYVKISSSTKICSWSSYQVYWPLTQKAVDDTMRIIIVQYFYCIIDIMLEPLVSFIHTSMIKPPYRAEYL